MYLFLFYDLQFVSITYFRKALNKKPYIDIDKNKVEFLSMRFSPNPNGSRDQILSLLFVELLLSVRYYFNTLPIKS